MTQAAQTARGKAVKRAAQGKAAVSPVLPQEVTHTELAASLGPYRESSRSLGVEASHGT